jgi:hypothetical protein
MQRTGKRQQFHFSIGRVEPRPAQFMSIRGGAVAMQGIVILVFAATVMDKSEKFDDPEVSVGLCREQPPVQKNAQPMIPAVKTTVPKPVACDQKLEELSRNSTGWDEHGNPCDGDLPRDFSSICD